MTDLNRTYQDIMQYWHFLESENHRLNRNIYTSYGQIFKISITF